MHRNHGSAPTLREYKPMHKIEKLQFASSVRNLIYLYLTILIDSIINIRNLIIL